VLEQQAPTDVCAADNMVAPLSFHFEVFGDGPHVIFLHGLSGSSRWWSRNVEGLSTRYRIYAVDLAGFGGSRRLRRFRLEEAVTLLVEWLDNVGIETAAVVGHSMGGLVAARLAVEAPERVARLVLVDAAFLSFDPGMAKRASGLVRAVGISSADLVRLVARDSLRADPISLGLATIDLLKSDWRSTLSQIQTPTLIIWGELDTVTPLTIARQIAATIPDARLVIIPGAGHVSMWDRPNEFNDEVIRFLG
jgi:pimeloyl-ACP methyl ester carboxylesterase